MVSAAHERSRDNISRSPWAARPRNIQENPRPLGDENPFPMHTKEPTQRFLKAQSDFCHLSHTSDFCHLSFPSYLSLHNFLLFVEI